MEIAPRINTDKNVRFGKPVIAGTRVPMELTLDKLAGGMSYEEVMAEYEITREDILAVLDYAAKTLKMSEGRDQLISIVGTAYFQPIADLLNQLMSHPYGEPNDIQTGRKENGYSSSICILSVVCFESFLMRVRYINRAHQVSKTKNPLDFLKPPYSDFQFFNELVETYVLRDVLVHSHLWQVDYSWNDESPMNLINAVRDSISGDKKYKNCVDPQKLETKLLRLNILPVRVNRQDVSKVLSTVWNGLLFLESKSREQCYVSDQYIKRNNQMVKFAELVSELQQATGHV